MTEKNGDFYSSNERFALGLLALISFCGLNVAFMYGVFFDAAALDGALKNPVSLAFICEAFLLLGAFTYLLGKWGKNRLTGGWFVFLSLLGGIAFALPLALLWPGRKKR